jgi:hypothetical protein
MRKHLTQLPPPLPPPLQPLLLKAITQQPHKQP